MIIHGNNANIKEVGPMIIKEYPVNKEFSGALVEIDGNHGKLKCLREDRIYFIIDGSGKFILNEDNYEVGPNDLVFVPKETPYNLIGKMKYFLLCSPEFNPDNDIML